MEFLLSRNNIFSKVLVAGLTVSSGVKAAYDYSEIVPMSSYDKDYRTLSCWECFEAKGVMCHNKNYDSMILETGSSNFGHGICCKPGYNEGYCATEGNDKHICS
jgi:hypothetical protein